MPITLAPEGCERSLEHIQEHLTVAKLMSENPDMFDATQYRLELIRIAQLAYELSEV